MKKSLLTVLIATAALSANAQSLTNGLVAYYPFDGNGNDASGNGRNLSAYNCTYSSALRGVGLTTGQLDIKSNLTNRLFSDYTLSTWVKISTLNRKPEWMYIIGGYLPNTASLRLCVDPNDPSYKKFNFGYSSASDVGYWLGTAPVSSLQTNQWYHLAATKASSSRGQVVSIYLNGSLLLKSTNSASIPIDFSNFSIGNDYAGNSPGSPFNGQIDEVRIYNRALSSNEVVSLYNLDRTLPTLVYGVSGTLNYTTASTDSSSKYNGYFVFNNSTLKSAFIWFKSPQTYSLESMNDIDFHTTTPYVGGKSIYSVANTEGTFPNIGKDVLWFTGANALIKLTNNISITTPAKLSGFANSLTLTNGTLISSYSASLLIDTINTTTALTNNESFDATITRLTNNLVRQGYTPVQ